jgi:DNA-binding transcriptional regulator/RsmH inhibitor MraZ
VSFVGAWSQNSTGAEPPVGIFSAKCDEKGRLKVPAEFAAYLKELGVERVFVTTVDLKLARIYPKQVWERNQNFFENAGEHAKIAKDVAFIANLYGALSDIDGNGRVLIPQELRKKLEIEGQTVWLDYHNGYINVFGKKIYDERMERAVAGLDDKVSVLETKGFK